MAQLQRFVIAMGVKPELLQIMVLAGNEQGEPPLLFLPSNFMAQLNITTPSYDARWEIVNERGAAALLGVIRGPTETHAALFTCERASTPEINLTFLHQGKRLSRAMRLNESAFIRPDKPGALGGYGGKPEKASIAEGSALRPFWTTFGIADMDAWRFRLSSKDLADIVRQERLVFLPFVRGGNRVDFEIASARAKLQGLIETCR